MVETVTRKRMEILVDTPLVPVVISHLRDAGVSGWSLISVKAGSGRQGEWRDDRLTGAAAKTIVLLITSEAKASVLIDSLEPILESHSLLLTAADIQVIRGERFD